MSSTVFSFAMSVLWCDIFAILIYILIQRKQFVVSFTIYPLLLLIILSVLRIILNIEFPFASVIHSKNIYPRIVYFFDFGIFRIQSFTVRVVYLFLAVWIAGSIYFLYRLIRQEVSFKKRMSGEKPTRQKRIYSIMDKVTDGKPYKVYIIETSLVSIPMITGLVRPTIYLPRISLSDSELYNVLLHEWTHYVHRDMWIKLFAKVICVIYWWNPFIYLLEYDIDNTLEVKSDLYITGKMTEKEKLDYLETILKVAKNLKTDKPAVSATSLRFMDSKKGHPLKQRFEFILECRPSGIMKKICILLSIFMVLLFAGSYSFVIQPYVSMEEYRVSEVFKIKQDNAFIVKGKDGTYSLYINNKYACSIGNIKDEPFSSLEIREMEE